MSSGQALHKGSAVVALMLLCLAAATPSVARESRPPLGLQLYCLQHKGACSSAATTSILASAELVSLLKSVNRRVNAAIQPRSDSGADSWSANGSAGDCEDYVMAKRQHLIAKGVPAGALHVAYTTTRSGEGHAILVVQTDAGRLVLDNLVSEVKSLDASGYRVQRMSSGGLLQWVSQN